MGPENIIATREERLEYLSTKVKNLEMELQAIKRYLKIYTERKIETVGYEVNSTIRESSGGGVQGLQSAN